MKLDRDCKYSEEHEWVRVTGVPDGQAVLGISDFAQEELSDVVYVELPEVGDFFAQGDILATVESVKAASDVYMPVSGEVLEINETLDDEPELVNKDPYGAAWFVRIRLDDPAEMDELMDADGYEAFLKTLDH